MHQAAHRAIQSAQTDCHIKAFEHQIKFLIGETTVHFKIGIAGDEVIDQRGNHGFAVGCRGGDFKLAARHLGQIANRALRIPQPIKQLSAMLIIDHPGLGRADLARGAVKQLHAKLFFERGDLTADLCDGNAKLSGRRGEALALGHGDKFADPVPRIHRHILRHYYALVKVNYQIT